MAGEIKISALPLAGTATDSDVTAGVQSGTTVKQTNLAVYNYIASKIAAAGDRYLSTNNYSTDNLLSAPNFTALKTETDNHIANLSNPHQTTVQQAYDQNQTVTLDSGALTFQDTSNVFQAAIDTKGSQFHAPIYHLSNGQTITLVSDSIDIIYSNDQAVSGSNVINIQLETSAIYATNGTFSAWYNGSRPFSVSAPSGVTINGVNNATINLVQGQFIKFIKTALNTFVSLIYTTNEVVRSWNGSTTPVDVTAGSGIDITNGVISTTGSGPTAAFGYISVQNLSTNLSYTDFTTWNGLPGTILYSNLQNFITGNLTPGDPTTPFYLEYTDVESAYFNFSSMFSCRRFSSTAQCAYYMSFGYNSATTPISGTLGDRQISYHLQGTGTLNSTVIPFSGQIMLNQGDRIFFLVRNDTTTTSADNDFLNTQQSVWIEKAGDVGGATAGVQSLNGLESDVELVSNSNTIAITPSVGDISLDAQLPVSHSSISISVISGGTLNSSIAALSDATTTSATGMVTFVLKATVTSDNSGNLIKLAITQPFSTTFTSSNQALPIQCIVTPTSLLGLPGAIGSGVLNNLFADTTNQWIEADIEVSQLSTQYTIWLSIRYQI